MFKGQETAASVSPSTSTGTLGKAMEVLEIIALADGPMRFTDILHATDQPRGTLHRQLANLAQEGLIQINGDGSHEPGIRLLKLAARSWSRNSLRRIAEPHLELLHEQTGETVHFGQLMGLEVIYLDKIESRQSVRMHSQVGNASPLYCTGIGKAMLGMLPEAERERLAGQFIYQTHTPTTLDTPQKLLSDLEEVAISGLAHDREEHEAGIRCVAAGIDAGTAIIGVSVTGPAFRVDDEAVEQWEPLVTKTAHAIENDIKSRMGPRNRGE